MTDVSDFSEFKVEDILPSLSNTLSIQLYLFEPIALSRRVALECCNVNNYKADFEYHNRRSTSCSFDLGLWWKIRVLAHRRAFLAVTTMPLTALARGVPRT